MLSIILPCHNELDRQAFMEEVEKAIPSFIEDFEIIGCNDRQSEGKGYAVRQALAQAKGNFICFLDGDGDINPRMIRRLIPFIEDHDVVLGTKPISGLWSRRILTFLSRYYIAILFGVKYETQTGIKLFRRHALTEWYNNGYLFDLEIICDAKKRGMRIIEVPIECKAAYRHMKLSSIWRTFKDSLTLWLELR